MPNNSNPTGSGNKSGHLFLGRGSQAMDANNFDQSPTYQYLKKNTSETKKRRSDPVL